MRPLILASLWGFLGLALTVRAAEPGGVGAILEDWRDAARDRTLPIKIDYPKSIDKLLPVVILSHGLGGSREGLAYIGQYLAAHGYVAVHLQHPGSDESVWKGKPIAEGLAAMHKAASPQQFFARIEDVKFALDELARKNADPTWPLHGKLNLKEIAMAGHSFGGVTTQAMCGQVFLGGKTFYDPRIKVGVVFSPSPPKGGDSKEAFGHMPIPMFYWTGTKDVAPMKMSNVTAEQRKQPYEFTVGPDHYQVVITDGDHMVFNGPRRAAAQDRPHDAEWHVLIEHGTAAFLDKYLKHDAPQAKYLDDGGFAKEVEPLGSFESKLR